MSLAYSPAQLAYLGDSVYETAIRKALVLEKERTLKDYNKLSMSFVCAPAQAKASKLLESLLTEEETDVMRRGRNAKCGNVPKNASCDDYRRATGLEALMGWLWLTGKKQRVDELVEIILKNTEEI